MNDSEAHEFCCDPEHLKPAGPARRRRAPRLTSMVPVRFPPEVIAAVSACADADGVTVSTWIRKAVSRALERPAGLVPGPGRASESRALPSSLAAPGRTFACPHMSIGNVAGAACGVCEPLRPAA